MQPVETDVPSDAVTRPRLTPDEDYELRRLHVFRRFGSVAGRLSARYDELRFRDRREKVREPANDSMQS